MQYIHLELVNKGEVHIMHLNNNHPFETVFEKLLAFSKKILDNYDEIHVYMLT